MIPLLGAETHTIKRTASGAYVDGEYVAGAETTFTVWGSLQPVSPRTLMQLPENQRTRASWVLLTEAQLNTVQVVGLALADRVEHNGIDYVVSGALEARFATHPLSHGQYVLLQPERGA